MSRTNLNDRPNAVGLSPMVCLFVLLFGLITTGVSVHGQAVIVDHNCTHITQIPQPAILAAKQTLHIAYGHTSHGSQLITGMDGLVTFMNGKGYPQNLYAWNNGGTSGALDLHDYAMGGDVGYYPDWVNNTHSYLGTANPDTGRGTGVNADVNVIIWSWCGQASGLTEQQMISNYLAPMSSLEAEYPGVKFVYMTGHLDGSGTTGNLNLRNEQIRTYCRQNNKVLYDFNDIECYDPDGLTNYLPLLANDNCDYDSDGNGSLDRNWALVWQGNHTVNVDWYDCSPAHTQALNGNLKAYAAWWLWSRLAGWDGGSGTQHTIAGQVTIGSNGLAGVVMSGLTGNPVTDATGNYSATVSQGWSGTVTPILEGYTFTPSSTVYTNVLSNRTTNYVAVVTPFTQTANMTTGWNWTSFNVLPTDLSLDSFFGGILDQVEQVKAQGKSAIRSGGAWTGDLVDMGDIASGVMYKIKVNLAGTLAVTGPPVTATTPIQLSAGWNWVTFYPQTAMPIEEALSSIISQVQQVKSQTQSAVPNGTGGFTGDLVQMEPGQGYSILVSQAVSLIYPSE